MKLQPHFITASDWNRRTNEITDALRLAEEALRRAQEQSKSIHYVGPPQV